MAGKQIWFRILNENGEFVEVTDKAEIEWKPTTFQQLGELPEDFTYATIDGDDGLFTKCSLGSIVLPPSKFRLRIMDGSTITRVSNWITVPPNWT